MSGANSGWTNCAPSQPLTLWLRLTQPGTRWTFVRENFNINETSIAHVFCSVATTAQIHVHFSSYFPECVHPWHVLIIRNTIFFVVAPWQVVDLYQPPDFARLRMRIRLATQTLSAFCLVDTERSAISQATEHECTREYHLLGHR